MDIKQRRRLTDLYARGALVELDDGGGDPVQVWLRKLTPLDAETAYVKAGARRASFMALARQEGEPTELVIALRAELEQFGKDDLVLWLTTQELMKRRDLIEMRVSYEEHWQKDSYLTGLQERVIDDDYQRKAVDFADDPEIVQVQSELDRYADEVDEAIEGEKRTLTDEFSALDVAELQQKTMDIMLETQADGAWVNEFQQCQIWLCCFDPEKRSERMFKTRAEVDLLQQEVIHRLNDELDKLHVGDQAGKDSQQTQVSSPPVE